MQSCVRRLPGEVCIICTLGDLDLLWGSDLWVWVCLVCSFIEGVVWEWEALRNALIDKYTYDHAMA